jgi:hypothetical protein
MKKIQIQSKSLSPVLGLMAFLMLTACSKISSTEVDASAISGDLYLTQYEGSNQATVRATFFVGGDTGTIVQLVSPANVTINGQAATEEDDALLNRTSYVGTSQGNATLIYTDKNGLAYRNVLGLPGSVSVSLSSTTAFELQGFSLGYSSTNAFSTSDQLTITLEGQGGAGVFRKNANAGATSGLATISSSELGGLAPGTYALKLCRRSYPSAQAPFPKGTNVTLESCSNARTLNLQL